MLLFWVFPMSEQINLPAWRPGGHRADPWLTPVLTPDISMMCVHDTCVFLDEHASLYCHNVLL